MRLACLSLAALAAASVHAEDCNPYIFEVIATSSDEAAICTQASGYSFSPYDLTFPNAEQLKGLCTNSACASIIAQLNGEYPTECDLYGAPLRSSLLDKFPAACAPPTPAPTTPAPTTRAPTTPAPTTKTPVVTTQAPTTAPPVLNGPCGNQQVGPTACPSGQYCQPWNPTQYQCRSIDAKCGVQEVGVDYNGDDLATFVVVLPEDCCNKCATTAGCAGYTFVNYNADGKAYCYLKKGPGRKVVSVGAVSAMIVPSAACTVQTPAKCTRQLSNVDLFGLDLSVSYGLTASDCCDRCAATGGCKAYTYVPTNAACYLKTGAGEMRLGVGLVSGLVN